MKIDRVKIEKTIGTLCLSVVTMITAVLLGKDVCQASTTKAPAGYTPIYTVEDLYGINDNLDGNYILMNDLDLSGTKPGGDWDAGNGWTPIGTSATNKYDWDQFNGIFDGNGYRIDNLTIYGTDTPRNLGLFASVSGTVKNLALNDVAISVDSCGDIGGIVGYNIGNIESCYVTGSIECDRAVNVGGIVGEATGDYHCNVNDCYSDVDIELSEDFGGNSGGVVGLNYNGNMLNCYAAGMINLNGADPSNCSVGAVASYDNLGANNCYYMGSLTDLRAKRLSTAQMKSSKCFTGFDFKNTWVVDKNSSYPYPQLRNCMQVRTESIELLSGPDKTSYYTTDVLDLSGSKLKINYEDNYYVTVPLQEEMLTYRMTEGTQTVKVNYNGCTAEFEIDVKKAPESLKITAKKTKLKIGSSYTYKAKYVGEGKLTFTSSNSRILKINKKTGKAVAKKAGTVTIMVKGGSLVKKITVKVVK